MRKLLVIVLLVNATLLGVRCWQDFPGAEAGGELVATENGDANGDGNRDIGDAVYLLSWLFQGGPEPVLCEPTGSRAPPGLPDTGQTWCYDGDGGEIFCDDPDSLQVGHDGFYETGCPPEDRFIDGGDGTVTDTCTELMWQQQTADADGDGTITTADRLWYPLDHLYCVDLEFAGHSDWRLPNVRELQSIVDYGRFDPATDDVFSTMPGPYWSSTFGTARVWRFFVHFGNGTVGLYLDDDAEGYFVRAVRTLQPDE